MSIAAAIAFSQPGGGGVGSAGFAQVGLLSLPVTISNGTVAASYTYELLDCPDNSALQAIKGIVQSGTFPTYTFTPDRSGGYLWHLQTKDANGNIADDVRAFLVPEPNGQIIPPFGATAPALNYPTGDGPVADNVRGWARLMERWLRLLATGGSGSANVGTALIDFGAAPGSSLGRVTVTGQATIASGSKVKAFVMYADSADNTDDEHLAARIDLTCGNIVVGVGFDILGASDHVLVGKFNVNWEWQ